MAKDILVLKHIDIEGPGSIEEFFRDTAWNLRVIDLSREKLWVKDINDADAIISLGGPMNVYEESKYPFLKDEDEFLKKALGEEIPILGICLGAQILAKACGAEVKEALRKEIGWHKVILTEEGMRDPLFGNMPAQFTVFQWHEDMFDIPEGAAHLAESPACRNQAFRMGKNAYGVQFHVEVNAEIIETWIGAYAKNETIETKEMLIEAYRGEDAFKKQAQILYHDFARIIAAAQKTGVG